MGEISGEEAAMLAALIYRPELREEWDVLVEDQGDKCTINDLVTAIEKKIKKQSKNEKFGAQMTKAEFQEVLNQIKASKTLMSLEVENIESNDRTHFRAMTLKPTANGQNSQQDMRPIIVFRGTAGNYQWDDNLSATISSLTPSQREAQKYVIQSGHEHVTIVGHSKGGNLAASMAYLLPEGMVDKAYSLDGQGASELFLANIPLEKQERAKVNVFNINEYRDIVSQLLKKMGDDKNTSLVDSGIDFSETGYGSFDFKMRFFHAHKPNYFLTKDVQYVDKVYTPALVGQISRYIDVNGMKKHQAIALLAAASLAVHGKEKQETAWNYRMWSAVYDAEEVYNRVNSERKRAILHKLSNLYGIDSASYHLAQEEDSFVVEGAVLTCPYCSGIGSLEQVENRTVLEQGRPRAVKTDCIPRKNICMEHMECALRSYEEGAGAASCTLELGDSWLLTDSSIKVNINGSGKEVEAVLKKSILGCFKGGWIEVVQNGQLEEGDYQRTKAFSNMKQTTSDVTAKLKGIKKKINNLPGEVIEDMGKEIMQGAQDLYNEMLEHSADKWDSFVEEMVNQAIGQQH